eukprot:8448335-Alexandrium_andersonii.AAC.1
MCQRCRDSHAARPPTGARAPVGVCGRGLPERPWHWKEEAPIQWVCGKFINDAGRGEPLSDLGPQ